MAKKKELKDPTWGEKCGTATGFKGHTNRGERSCLACRETRNLYYKLKRAGIACSMTETWSEMNVRWQRHLNGENPDGEQHEVPEPPAYLEHTGRQLWNDVASEFDLNPAAQATLGEACRARDRMERMAAALSSRTTFWFEIGDIELADEAGVPVVVNPMLGEARQQAALMDKLLTRLGVSSSLPVKTADEKTNVLDQLAERRRQRQVDAREDGA